MIVDTRGWIDALDIAGEHFERFAARLEPESALRERTLTLAARMLYQKRMLEKIEALETSTTDDPGAGNTNIWPENDEWG